MKLSLIENGIDSLQKGYKFLAAYEKALVSEKGEKERSYILKDAIVYIHHGVEILMKHTLSINSEYLLFSTINKDIKQAFLEKNQKNLTSVFETTKKMKIHTVTYVEAFERLKYICGHKFSKKFEDSIKQLDDYRNLLTHSEFHLNEANIISLFDNFIGDIDHYFLKAIGEGYKTMSGYSTLIENSQEYIEALKESGLELKSKFLTSILSIFDDLGFGMGNEEKIEITDINIVVKLFDGLYKDGFEFGTDLYNMICSGNVASITRIGKEHISMFTKDNNLEIIFKFRRLIFYLPNMTSSESPIFFFESDDDLEAVEKNKDILLDDSFDKHYLDGLYFYEDNRRTTDAMEIGEFYTRMDYDDDYIVPPYHRVYQYTDKGMFAFLNIQGLAHGNYASLVRECKDMDGKEFLIKWKQSN